MYEIVSLDYVNIPFGN